MNRNTLFVILGVVTAAIIGAVVLRQKNTPSYQFTAVKRAAIVQEVLASGNVESPTTSDLHFKSSGKLTALNVVVGQQVAKGAILAKQDTSILDAELAQAQAATAAAQANLKKLQVGATSETIAVSQSKLDVADQTLQNAYASVPNALADAYAKANDAVVNQLASFFVNAQTANPQLTFSVGASDDPNLKDRIVAERLSVTAELAAWKNENAALNASDTAALETSLQKAEAHLTAVRALLTDAVAAVAANIDLSAANATTYRASASTGLAETNTAFTNIQTLAQGIDSDKAAVAAAQAALNLTVASSTPEDISAQEAAVTQAQANADSISAQIRDLEIIAPFDGTITDTNRSVGEVVTASDVIVSLIPHTPLDIKVNVSENNVVSVAPGDAARIQLDAFPSTTEFAGTVRTIDPAQTTIGGAIYYQTTVDFNKMYAGIKPGMTANVWIKTGSATSTLVVPASALTQNGTETTARVLRGGTVVSQTVTTGLQSQDGMVEILTGLSEGEQVVIGQ
ncbi:MAG: efflux RND transporter periplasmic adaptor subunit [Patescibacteria group bacterium]|nr:efflux RND transporter periplasmic adaptor subunit [Patescibacteria group bacterium]